MLVYQRVTFKSFEPLLGEKFCDGEDLKFVAATRRNSGKEISEDVCVLGGDVTPSADLKKGRSTLFQVISRLRLNMMQDIFYDWIFTCVTVTSRDEITSYFLPVILQP